MDEFEEKVKKQMAFGFSRKVAEERVMLSEQLGASTRFYEQVIESSDEVNKYLESLPQKIVDALDPETLATIKETLKEKEDRRKLMNKE